MDNQKILVLILLIVIVVLLVKIHKDKKDAEEKKVKVANVLQVMHNQLVSGRGPVAPEGPKLVNSARATIQDIGFERLGSNEFPMSFLY